MRGSWHQWMAARTLRSWQSLTRRRKGGRALPGFGTVNWKDESPSPWVEQKVSDVFDHAFNLEQDKMSLSFAQLVYGL